LLSSSQKPAPISVSPVTSTIMDSPSKTSPSRQGWHKKGSPGRLTLKLKNVSKTAKVFSHNLIFICFPFLFFVYRTTRLELPGYILNILHFL
jgi:hypothetical protein